MPKSVYPPEDFEELLLQSLNLTPDKRSFPGPVSSPRDGHESDLSSPESIYPSDEKIAVSLALSLPCSGSHQSGLVNDRAQSRNHSANSAPQSPTFPGRLTEDALRRHTKLWEALDHTIVYGGHESSALGIFDQRRAITPSLRRKGHPVLGGRFSTNTVPVICRPGRESPMNFDHELKNNLPVTNPVQIVRNFSTSSKGIINQGDSLRRHASPVRSTPSNEDGNSWTSGSSCSSCCSSARSSQTSHSDPTYVTSHKVLILGSASVGKTSLARQFMTSEYMGLGESEQDRGPCSNVSVRLDTQETNLNFVRIPPEEDILWHDDVSAYLVLYSVSDVTSFQYAARLLGDIRETLSRKTATILVGNKADIVRNRNITQSAGKKLATKHRCKYIEISTVLNHKVDDLLVGTVSQIRLSQKQHKVKTGNKQAPVSDHSDLSLVHKVHKATQGVSRVLRKYPLHFRSCDNLLV